MFFNYEESFFIGKKSFLESWDTSFRVSEILVDAAKFLQILKVDLHPHCLLMVKVLLQ